MFKTKQYDIGLNAILELVFHDNHILAYEVYGNCRYLSEPVLNLLRTLMSPLKAEDSITSQLSKLLSSKVIREEDESIAQA